MKTIKTHVHCFDSEWAPCLTTGRFITGLAGDTPDDQIRAAMWKRSGATAENPRPFLKLAVCRVVSISAIHRCQNSDGTVRLKLRSFPEIASDKIPEGEIIGSFLNEVTGLESQLVGFNSAAADLPILIQRGIAARCQCAAFGTRTEKPWEGMDYFSRFAESHVDLANVLTAGASGRGAAMPSLNEIAAALGIPGKLDHSGGGVLDLCLSGDFATLTGYNETDACTTYLIWLRVAYFLGKLSVTSVIDGTFS